MESRRRKARVELRALTRTAAGRQALLKASRERIVAVVEAMHRAPDRTNVAMAVRGAALERAAALGGEEAMQALGAALSARGTDLAIATMVANQAITDGQALCVVRALGRLAEGGSLPPAFAERLSRGQGNPLRMTTALAGVGSSVPRQAQAAAYEIHATASIVDNPRFPFPFSKGEIASFHYRFQHNSWGTGSGSRSFEGDIVVAHGLAGPTTFVDFKHTVGPKASVERDEIERITHGLLRGEIDRAVIVSNKPLSTATEGALRAANERLAKVGDGPIRTFVQPW